MAVASQSGVPCRFTAGDAVLFTFSDREHPASLWYLDFVLIRNGAPLATTRATADGDNYQVSISNTASAVAPGVAQYALVYTLISDATQRETGCSGWINILPNPTATLEKSTNQLALDACNSAIQALSASRNATVSFNGQSFTSQSIGELFKARDRLQIIVDNELRALGLSRRGGARLILARFR